MALIEAAIADTSVFIAREAGRPLDEALIPSTMGVSVITIGELRYGLLMARDPATRDDRERTLASAQRNLPIAVDQRVAASWGRLQSLLHHAGQRMPVNDSWIAATALAHGVPVVTQDADYDVDVAGLEVIRV